MCTVTDTWLQNRDEDKAWCDTSAFNNDNLVLHNVNQETCRGGAVALITKSNLIITILEIDKPSSFEAAEWRMSLPGKNITLIAIYRPPYSKNYPMTIAMFIDEFTVWIVDQLTTDGNILLLGDFNMQTNRCDTNADKKIFMDTIEALGLQQWVDFGTYHLGNTIDLVFTELASNIEILRCTPGPFIFDDCVVKCEIKHKRDRPIVENTTYYKINKIDINAFVKDLVLTGDTDHLDPAMMIHVFQHELCRVLDKHAPMVTRKLPIRQPKPWFNEDIKE